MAYISAVYDATFGSSCSYGILGVSPASLVNLAGFENATTQRLQSQVNFLETSTSGADHALKELQTQAVPQYTAIMAIATGSRAYEIPANLFTG
tara:strand:- start:141 stop:422 length:282 start_codon:yes stop_codon:yes gene_type:complete